MITATRRGAVLLIALSLLAVACGTGATDVTIGRPGTTVAGTEPTTPSGPIDIDRPGVQGIFAAAGLNQFDACADFLDYVIGHAVDLVGPYGLPGNYYYWGGPFPAALESTADASTSAGQEAPRQAGVDYSTTNVQEAGVDEPDIVKTDGDRILALAQGRLWLIDASGNKPEIRGSMLLSSSWNHQIFLSGDRVLVMGNGDGSATPLVDTVDAVADIAYPGFWTPVTVIEEIDISDPADMDVVRTLVMDGNYLSARMVDDTVRVVVTSGPTGFEWAFPEGSGLRAEREAVRKNREIIENSTIENWVPYYVLEDSIDRTTQEGPLLSCAQAAHPEEFAGFNMLNILTIDLERGLEPGIGVGVLADGQTVYASQDALYVATNPWFDWWGWQAGTVDDPDETRTQIHKFETAGSSTRYVATGSVQGWLLNQFAMDEHDGYLRVASTNSNNQWGWVGPESESFVTVLAQDGGELAEVGKVGGMGEGERIFSVRFIDDMAYVVTFRQVDPLYTVDLSDPEDPTVAGELKILGYSAYLHPVGDGLLLGIGQDATEEGRTLGTQFSLFDVSDPDNPRRLSAVSMEDAYSEAEWDHKAVLYWPQTGTAVVPLTRWSWDERTETEDYFAGALAIEVGEESLRKIGTLSHQDGVEGDYKWMAPIRRSLVIDGKLFTVSEVGLEMSELETLEEIDFLRFEV